MQNYLVYTPVLGAAGLLLAVFLILGISRLLPGTIVVEENAYKSKSLLRAFLNRYYIIATGVALVAFCVLWYLNNWLMACCFLAGALTIFLLLNQTVANLKRAEQVAAASSPDKAIAVLLCAASASGLLAVSITFMGCSLLFFYIGTPESLHFFVLGVSLSSLLFTAINESSLLSPCRQHPSEADTFALLVPVTTNLDLFGSATAALAGVMSIGALGMVQYGFGGVLLPLAVFAAALSGCIGILLLVILLRKRGWLRVTAVLSGIFVLFLLLFTMAAVKILLPGEQVKVFLSFGAGLGGAIVLLLPWYVKPPFFASKSRNYHLLITIPVLLLAIAVSYYTSGFYGVSMATLAVILPTGIAVFLHTLQQMQDYAPGAVETQSDEPVESDVGYQEIAAGEDDSAKSFSCFNIGAAALAAVVLLLTFVQMAGIREIPINSGMVLLGLVIGGLLPYLFSGWMAGEEVRFGNTPGENEKPEDENTAGEEDNLPLSDGGEYKEPLLVLLMATAIPVLTGLLLDTQTLAALLVGALISGVLLAVLRVREHALTTKINLLVKYLLIVSVTLVVSFLA